MSNPIIEIQPGKQYSGAEVVERLNTLLDAVAHHRRDDKLRYSSSDCYWIIKDLFRYINKDIRGEFRMKRLKRGTWKLEYHRKSEAELKHDRAHSADINRTRDLINRLKR